MLLSCELETSSKEDGFKKTIKQIELDIYRTHSCLPHFKIGGSLYKPLKDLLMAFAVYRPDFGYVQGFNYLAATILIAKPIDDKPHTSLVLLSTLLMRESMLFDFYSFKTDSINKTYHIFMHFLKINAPKLYSSLIQN